MLIQKSGETQQFFECRWIISSESSEEAVDDRFDEEIPSYGSELAIVFTAVFLLRYPECLWGSEAKASTAEHFGDGAFDFRCDRATGGLGDSWAGGIDQLLFQRLGPLREIADRHDLIAMRAGCGFSSQLFLGFDSSATG